MLQNCDLHYKPHICLSFIYTLQCYSTVTPDSVFRLPIVDSAQESDTSPPEGATPDTTPSLASSTFSFTSDSLAVVCDGNATLYLLDTGNRTEPIQQWKVGLFRAFF